jgi:hypothetical protein
MPAVDGIATACLCRSGRQGSHLLLSTLHPCPYEHRRMTRGGVVSPSSATTPSEGSGWIANPPLSWTFTNYTPPAFDGTFEDVPQCTCFRKTFEVAALP